MENGEQAIAGTYLDDPTPTLNDLEILLSVAYLNFARHRVLSARIESTTRIYLSLDLDHDYYAELPCGRRSDGSDNIRFLRLNQVPPEPPFLRVKVDPRLLLRILLDSKGAYWQPQGIWEHVKISGDPAEHDQRLYWLLQTLHCPP